MCDVFKCVSLERELSTYNDYFEHEYTARVTDVRFIRVIYFFFVKILFSDPSKTRVKKKQRKNNVLRNNNENFNSI